MALCDTSCFRWRDCRKVAIFRADSSATGCEKEALQGSLVLGVAHLHEREASRATGGPVRYGEGRDNREAREALRSRLDLY